MINITILCQCCASQWQFMKAWIETSFVCSIFLQKLEKSVVKAQILFLSNACFLSGNYLGTIIVASDIIRC